METPLTEELKVPSEPVLVFMAERRQQREKLLAAADNIKTDPAAQ